MCITSQQMNNELYLWKIQFIPSQKLELEMLKFASIYKHVFNSSRKGIASQTRATTELSVIT